MSTLYDHIYTVYTILYNHNSFAHTLCDIQSHTKLQILYSKSGYRQKWIPTNRMLYHDSNVPNNFANNGIQKSSFASNNNNNNNNKNNKNKNNNNNKNKNNIEKNVRGVRRRCLTKTIYASLSKVSASSSKPRAWFQPTTLSLKRVPFLTKFWIVRNVY